MRYPPIYVKLIIGLLILHSESVACGTKDIPLLQTAFAETTPGPSPDLEKWNSTHKQPEVGVFGYSKDRSGNAEAEKETTEIPQIEVLTPVSEMVLNTKFGSVTIGAGARVAIVETNKQLSLYNLYSETVIVIKSGSDNLTLAPGHCAFVTAREGSDFGDLNPYQTVSYRLISRRNFGVIWQVDEAEFLTSDFLSLIPTIPIMTSVHWRNPYGKALEFANKQAADNQASPPFQQALRKRPTLELKQ